jgi:hypothetical protein
MGDGWQREIDARTGRPLWRLRGPAGVVAGGSAAVSFGGDDAVVVCAAPADGGWTLQRVALADGASAPCAPLAGLLPHAFSVHPDGQRVVVVTGSGLWALALDGAPPERLADLAAVLPAGSRPAPAPPAFTRDGRTVVIGAHALAGTLTLVAAELATGRLTSVMPVPGLTGDRLLPCPTDAHALLVADAEGAVGVVDLRSRSMRPLPEVGACCCGWSTDGQRIRFLRAGSIASCDALGGDVRVDLGVPCPDGPGALSADGRYLLAAGTAALGNPLLLVDLVVGRTEILCWPEPWSQAGFSRSRRHAVLTAAVGGIRVVPL